MVTENSNREKELEEQVIKLNNELTYERQLRVSEEAKRAFSEDNGGRFEIRLKIPTGNTIINAFGDEELEYKPDTYDTKTYHYHKLSANDYNTYMMKRGELNSLVSPEDQVKAADLLTRMYEFMAMKYLGMKHDDYVRAEWDDVHLAVDVCNHVNEWAAKDIQTIPGENKVRVISSKDIRKAEIDGIVSHS